MPNLLARLMPRENSFFILFKEVTENLKEAAIALSDLATNYTDVESKVQKIKALEHRGDDMTHRLAIKLSQTFITPFDREDIHQLRAAGLRVGLDGELGAGFPWKQVIHGLEKLAPQRDFQERRCPAADEDGFKRLRQEPRGSLHLLHEPPRKGRLLPPGVHEAVEVTIVALVQAERNVNVGPAGRVPTGTRRYRKLLGR